MIDKEASWSRKLAEQAEGNTVVSTADECPDCDGTLHRPECRRSGLAVDPGGGFYDLPPRAYLQFGPPWYEWADEAAS
jgi:hypothetical protein